MEVNLREPVMQRGLRGEAYLVVAAMPAGIVGLTKAVDVNFNAEYKYVREDAASVCLVDAVVLPGFTCAATDAGC